jgi:hypothetical protein
MAKVTINGYEVELEAEELLYVLGALAQEARPKEATVPTEAAPKPLRRKKVRGVRNGSVEESVMYALQELTGSDLDDNEGAFKVEFLAEWLEGVCNGRQVQNACNRLTRKNRLRKARRGQYRLPEKRRGTPSE